jgi:hypothetical protein
MTLTIFVATRWHFVFLVCCLLSSITRPILGDEPGNIELSEEQRAVVVRFLEAAKKVWEDDYGNVHYDMFETLEYRGTKGKQRIVREIKYWSRDNRYFRLDAKTIESNSQGELVGSRRRVVVRPDGFVGLSARSAKSPLVVVEWGTAEQGLDWLLGNSSVLASLRSHGLRFAIIEIGGFVSSEQLLEVPSSLMVKGIERKLTGVTLLDSGSRFEVKWMRYDGPLSGELTMLCDVEHGVVQNCEGRNMRNGIISSDFKEIKEYEFNRFRGIPSFYRNLYDEAVSAESDHYSRTTEIRPRLVDWNPVPMGIFSLEAQGLRSVAPGSVWSRRLLTLLVGLVLLGIFVAIKRARDRATE